MKRQSLAGVALFLLATAHALESEAVVATAQAPRAHVVYQGSQSRLQRATRTRAPTRQALQLLRDFEADLGGAWEVIWDAHTAVPLTLIGSGAAFAGANADALVASQVSQSLLAAHLDLLAPGSTPGDFVERGSFDYRGLRTVTFEQLASGQRVDGASITFGFRNDHLILVSSTAFPNVVVPLFATTKPSAAQLTQVAEQRVRADLGGSARANRVSTSSEVLPIVSESGVIEYVPVYRVEVKSQQPFGHWAVFVSVGTGQAVARRQLHRDFDGVLTYDVVERWPGGTRVNLPAAFANLTINGQAATSGAEGQVTWMGANPASLTARASGPFVNVVNQDGAAASAALTLSDGGTQNWSAASNETIDAQINTFVHVNLAKVVARELNPHLEWLEESLTAYVNVNDACNAYFTSEDNSLNFFRAGANCSNTGRLADVVYHEFGHALHFNTLRAGAAGGFDEALSEGLGDYFAATITNDSGMGRGFQSAAPLRDVDPAGDEAVWPADVDEDPHETGLIIGGTLWDLRKLLIEKHGADAGVTRANTIFYGVMSNAPDIAGSYGPALAADDDDGILSNGTPNFCEIRQAFQAHGLVTDTNVAVALTHERSDWQITVNPAASAASCMAVQSVTLDFRLRENTTVSGNVTLTNNGAGWVGNIPEQAAGQVVQYRIHASTDLGDAELPANRADPWYEFFVGDVVELYCSDFETDPFADGWSHDAPQGTDDWEWGAPDGLARDPKKAVSGTSVVGNDLMTSGLYSPNSESVLTSPAVDTSGFRNVRIQYQRFLAVEDAEYDQATISVDGAKLWENAATDSTTDDVAHEDGEWRFHDLDVSEQAQDGEVKVTYALTSDEGLHLSGWTIDDFCVVGYTVCGDGVVEGLEACDAGPGNSATLPNACRTTCQLADCGDGVIDTGETCDNGAANSDSVAGACRSTCQPARCGDGVIDGDEQCDDGNTVDADACSNACSPPLPTGTGGTTGGSGSSGSSGSSGTPSAGAPASVTESGCGCRSVGGRENAPGAASWITLGLAAALSRLISARRARSRRSW